MEHVESAGHMTITSGTCGERPDLQDLPLRIEFHGNLILLQPAGCNIAIAFQPDRRAAASPNLVACRRNQRPGKNQIAPDIPKIAAEVVHFDAYISTVCDIKIFSQAANRVRIDKILRPDALFPPGLDELTFS